MHLARILSVLLLSFSVALAGIPAQAMSGAMKDCPMMKMQQETAKQDMKKVHDCDGCPQTEKQQSQKKSGCCDDAACNVKCSASGGMSLSAPSKKDLPQLMPQAQRFYPADAALVSYLLSTQDRPPKALS